MTSKQFQDQNYLSDYTPTIPDNAPIVSFDINIGKTYSHVGFDYDGFDKLAGSTGLSEDAQKKLNIRVVAPQKRLRAGGYDPKEHSIEIEVDPEDTNIYLAHETQHAADITNGYEQSRLRYKIANIGKFALKTSIPTMITATGSLVGGIVGSVITKEPSPAIVGFSVGGSLLAETALGLGALYYGYYTHPLEIRAFNAQKRKAEHVVSLSKRR